MRLIDADALKNYIENDGYTEAFAMAQIGREGKFFLMGNIIADIDEQPTVTERTGHWIEIGENAHAYKCSECGRLLVNITDGKKHVYKYYPYCHCGAHMIEEDK